MASEDLTPAQRRRLNQLTMRIGAMHAFTISASMDLAARTAVLREIKETKEYKEFSSTWEGFCSDYLPWARRTVDEDIRFLDRLGEDFIEAAEAIGLGRRQLRALSSAPPELLPKPDGDALVIGEERISLDEKERVVEAVEDLITEQERLRMQVEAGEEQLRKKDGRVRELAEQVREMEEEERGERVTEFERRMLIAMANLTAACDELQEPDPEKRVTPRLVYMYVMAKRKLDDELLSYATNYQFPQWLADRRLRAELRDASSVAHGGVAEGLEVHSQKNPVTGLGPEAEARWNEKHGDGGVDPGVEWIDVSQLEVEELSVEDQLDICRCGHRYAEHVSPAIDLERPCKHCEDCAFFKPIGGPYANREDDEDELQ